jgi:hypothetical protein
MLEDFDDDLSDLLGGRPMRPLPITPRPLPVLPAFVEPCRKCGGRGRYGNLGPCFKCKGQGKKTFKTSPEARANSKANAAARKQCEADELRNQVAAFKATHPEVIAWMDSAGDFPFAVAMREALDKWGGLTENQMAACLRCVEGRQKAQQAKVEREAAAPEISIEKIHQALQAARSHQVKWPKLDLDTFTFKLAGDNSKNPGAIYVTEGDEYLGKIVSAKFVCVKACGGERQSRIIAAAADPERAAVAYGRRTGNCSCCGRLLTNGISIDRGIGPICAEKFGW